MQPETIYTAPVITVTEPIVHVTGFYHTYLTSGNDQHGKFQTRRCFHDFVILRERMVREWPGCYIPSLPNKQFITALSEENKDAFFVEHRRRFIQYFCSKIATLPYLYESNLFQLLLRHPDEDLDKAFKSIQEQKTTGIIEKYHLIFDQNLTKMLLFDLNKKIEVFLNYIKKVEKGLKKISQQTKDLAFAKRQYQIAMNNANIMLLPGFESQFLSFHLQDFQDLPLFPMSNNAQVCEAARNMPIYIQYDGLDFLQSVIELELREIEVMHFLMNDLTDKQNLSKKIHNSRVSHQDQLSKLLSGKTTIKSMFRLSPKQQQIMKLQQKTEQQQRQIEALEIIIEYMIRIIGGVQIDRFKTTRKTQYYQNINMVSKLQIRNMVAYGALEKCIAIALSPLNEHIHADPSDNLIREKTEPLNIQHEEQITKQDIPKIIDKSEQQQVQSCYMQPQRNQQMNP